VNKLHLREQHLKFFDFTQGAYRLINVSTNTLFIKK